MAMKLSSKVSTILSHLNIENNLIKKNLNFYFKRK